MSCVLLSQENAALPCCQDFKLRSQVLDIKELYFKVKPVQAFWEARVKPRLFSLIWEAQGISLGLNKVDVKAWPTWPNPAYFSTTDPNFSLFFMCVCGGGGRTMEYHSLEIIIPY